MILNLFFNTLIYIYSYCFNFEINNKNNENFIYLKFLKYKCYFYTKYFYLCFHNRLRQFRKNFLNLYTQKHYLNEEKVKKNNKHSDR